MNYTRDLDAASRRTMTGPPAVLRRRPPVVDEEAKPRQVTRRELQLMFGVARGRTLAQMSMDLHLGASTVKTHMHNLMTKTNCHTQAQLVSWGYRNGYMHGLKPEPRPAMKFTAREMSVLQYAVLGLENPDIAHRLILSLDSVKTYMTRLRIKMQAKSRAHIAALAWQLGLVKLEWWEDLGVAQPAPVRLIMPAPEGWEGKIKMCPSCGGNVVPVHPSMTDTGWVQDSLW